MLSSYPAGYREQVAARWQGFANGHCKKECFFSYPVGYREQVAARCRECSKGLCEQECFSSNRLDTANKSRHVGRDLPMDIVRRSAFILPSWIPRTSRGTLAGICQWTL
ncbi:hypothetical protein [Legionella wadsworthii]|uniref:hypothetical protein n=1 Tax=Legionella wadsworthii TaxID=28088 RepID=UPI0011C06F13|nr:hypothetical protein [Legionella wadsworthii]